MSYLISKISGQEYDLKHSVRQHVFNLMNTRQGSLVHMPDYGLPELSPHHACIHAKKSYIKSLKDLILQFEPRITSLEVKEDTADNHGCILQLTLKVTLSNRDLLTLDAQLVSGHVIVSEPLS